MVDPHELSLRLLAELEEFHHENVPAMMNTLLQSASRSEAIPVMQSALFEIVDSGLAHLIHSDEWELGARTSTAEKSISMINNIADMIVFDPTRNCWTDKRLLQLEFKGELDQILLTPAGLERSNAILDERGYRWWQQNNGR